MRQTFFFAAAIFASSGCAHQPVEVKASTNPQINVALMFSHDGCDVYRFFDLGYRYYVRCDGKSAASTSWNEGCGKNCVRQVTVETAAQ
jgi:hypothetical protein